ncbi:MAG: cell division protein FtsA [Candidatus Handelsmanbacteria bacterium]|nr:cell division protein FtsA [Candidatus Handelsmanbacteria bacterium]
MSGSPIVVLDIGTAKVLCVVGEQQPDDKLKILGMGSSPCRGLRRSSIIDMPKVVDSIAAAVTEAGRSTGLKITGAYMGMAGESVSVHTSHSTVAISGTSTPIDDNDMQRGLVATEQAMPAGNAIVLHRFIQSYAVDGEYVQNPLWLHGNKLEIETLSILAARQSCTTLQRAAEEAGVEIAGFIHETVAAASALISPDEREMGVALLDIGAGTSDLAIFHGQLRHLAEIPFGGDDLTKDLSVVLSTSPREAEQLKQLHGYVCGRPEGADQNIAFKTTAGRPHSISHHQLKEIIEARQQEIFEFVRQELERNRYGKKLAAGLILTGGGAMLENIAQLGEEVLGVPVRLGSVQEMLAAPGMEDPQYAAAIGLIRFALDEEAHEAAMAPAPQSGKKFLDKLARIFSFM